MTPLWLESVVRTEQPRVLLAASADSAELSPAGDAALYTDDRGAWAVRPLAVPKEVFFAARQAAECWHRAPVTYPSQSRHGNGRTSGSQK